MAGFFNPAQAQEVYKSFKKPMPVFAGLAAPAFEAGTAVYKDMPFDDPSLAYRFRLPKDWKKAPDGGVGTFKVGPKVLSDLTRFYGPYIGDQHSGFRVQAVQLEYRLKAEQWLLEYLIANGYAVEGFAALIPDRAEALYVRVEGDTSYVVRAAAIINGKNLVYASYEVPLENWKEQRAMQAGVISDFTLTTPVQALPEAMKDYRFIDIAQMSYPASWELRASPVRTVDSLGVNLYSYVADDFLGEAGKKQLKGKIQIQLLRAAPNQSADDALKAMIETLRAGGVGLKDNPEPWKDIRLDSSMKLTHAAVYKAVIAENPALEYELLLVTAKAGDYDYLMTLLTLPPAKDFAVWARNTESFKLVAATVKPAE